MHKIVIIGYSGHAFVVCDMLRLLELEIVGYCEIRERDFNPFNLKYLGSESKFKSSDPFKMFIAIGDNVIRERIGVEVKLDLVNVIHPSAVVADSVSLGSGILMSANATINSLVKIGNGVIINTGAIVEHECIINNYAHIAPSAVLAGNVKVGSRSFIGANSVIKQGVTIGSDVIIGAGSVIINDIPDGCTVVGNPGRVIK